MSILSQDSNYIADVVMCPKFCNSSNYMREVIIISILERFDQKKHFFPRIVWLMVNDLGLTLGMGLKFYTDVAEVLKLKVRKFWGLILRFVEVPEEKLIKGRGGYY